MENKLYLVSEGKVFEVEPDHKCNWETECLVLATCDEGALFAAKQYDNGTIQYDNHVYCGVTIVALRE
jgi:hypothetical protein